MYDKSSYLIILTILFLNCSAMYKRDLDLQLPDEASEVLLDAYLAINAGKISAGKISGMQYTDSKAACNQAKAEIKPESFYNCSEITVFAVAGVAVGWFAHAIYAQTERFKNIFK